MKSIIKTATIAMCAALLISGAAFQLSTRGRNWGKYHLSTRWYPFFVSLDFEYTDKAGKKWWDYYRFAQGGGCQHSHTRAITGDDIRMLLEKHGKLTITNEIITITQ